MIFTRADVQAFYNRISLEHEVHLDVAKAMFTATAVMLGEVIDARAAGHDSKAVVIISGFTNTWMAIAGPLGMSEDKMRAAIESAIDLALTHIEQHRPPRSGP